MIAVDSLRQEHDHILRFLEVLRQAAIDVLEGKPLDVAHFRALADFASSYADHYHHGKEEKILFPRMLDELGPVADKMIRRGMLVEHEIGRTHIRDLRDALDRYEASGDSGAKLDVLANAAGYARDLERHITRENSAVFTFAEQKLSETGLADANEETSAYEEENTATREALLAQLDAWTEASD